jgi:hypothetical protein
VRGLPRVSRVSVGGQARRVLLLGALILGVLSMHALVLAPPMHSGDARSAAATWVPAVAHDHAAGGGLIGGEVGAQAAPMISGPATEVATPMHEVAHGGAGHGPGAPSGLHDLMHLCLAVLAGVVLVIAAVLLVSVVASTHRDGEPDRPEGTAGLARPPPRTAVRLAQLCVLRT